MKNQSVPKLPWVTTRPLAKKQVTAHGVKIPSAFLIQCVLAEPHGLKRKRDAKSKWIVQLFIEVTKQGYPEILKLSILGSTCEITSPPIWEIERFPNDLLQVDSLQLAEFEAMKKKLVELGTIDVAANWYLSNDKQSWLRNPRKPELKEQEQKALGARIDKQLHQRLTPDFLSEVAKLQETAIKYGKSPNVAIADHYGTSIKNVERWVATCRREGYLPPIGKGRKAK